MRPTPSKFSNPGGEVDAKIGASFDMLDGISKALPQIRHLSYYLESLFNLDRNLTLLSDENVDHHILKDITVFQGASAYEIALDQGFVGTASEWLESLIGADGDDGAAGIPDGTLDFDVLTGGSALTKALFIGSEKRTYLDGANDAIIVEDSEDNVLVRAGKLEEGKYGLRIFSGNGSLVFDSSATGNEFSGLTVRLQDIENTLANLTAMYGSIATAAAAAVEAENAAITAAAAAAAAGQSQTAAEAAQSQAEAAFSAANAAQVLAGNYTADAQAAEANAAQAYADSEDARVAAEAAKALAEDAQSAAEAAETNSEAALQNTNNALQDAQDARDAAEDAKTNALTSANNAATSASAAGSMATTAAGSATVASQHADEAGSSASIAQAAVITAEAHRDDAEDHAAAALASEASATTASQDATSAAATATQQKELATTAATNAENSASAAATSETTAASHATDAEQSASAADTSRLQAETARSGAETAESSAVTAKNNAESASATASTQAGLSATSATDAENSATASASSATVAESHATDAAQSASTADTSRIDAETAEANAVIAKNDAVTAKQDAESASATATAQAGLAAQSETNANNSASAAAGSATAAATEATDAAQSATAAEASALSANTSESSAAASETSAASAKTDAETAAASAVESSEIAAEAAKFSVPANLADDGFFIKATGSSISFPEIVDPDIGRSGHVTNSNHSNGGITIFNRKRYEYVPGKTFHIESIIKKIADRVSPDDSGQNTNTGDVWYSIMFQNADGSYNSRFVIPQGDVASSAPYEHSAEIDIDTYHASDGGAGVAFYLGINVLRDNDGELAVSRIFHYDKSSEFAADAAASASASSAASAAASETASGQNASAAETSRLAAETAESAAEIAKTEAITAKNSAEGSAASAATQAGVSTTAATDAGNFATAAAGSATLADSKATDAEQSALSASASQNAAETAEAAALTYRNEAATSATNASGSASAAASSEGLAATAATDAEDSATASANSATFAAASETAAGQFASSSDTSRQAAETAQSAANISATNAADSATNAGTSEANANSAASAAAGSETAASSTYDATLDTYSQTLPRSPSSTPEDFGWAYSGYYAPTGLPVATVDDATEGVVLHWPADNSSNVYTRYGFKIDASRTYRATVEALVKTDPTGDTTRFIFGFSLHRADRSYVTVYGWANYQNFDNSDGWVTHSIDVTGADLLAAEPTAVYVRTRSQMNRRTSGGAASDGETYVRVLAIEDVTAEAATSASAQAAATSESSASTFADAASTSAAAASANAINAATSASTAGIYESNAATSETNASDFAAAAATSARLSASSSSAGGYGNNPHFADWEAANNNPTGWVNWSTGGTFTRESSNRRFAGIDAVKLTTSGSSDYGITSNVHTSYNGGYGFLGEPDFPEKVIVTTSVYLESGSWDGAGVFLQFLSGTAGNGGGSGSVMSSASIKFKDLSLSSGKWVTLSELIDVPTGATGFNIYGMNNYVLLGTKTAKTLIFGELNVRAATEEEIAASRVSTIEADVLSEQAARISGDAANAASLTAVTSRVDDVEADSAIFMQAFTDANGDALASIALVAAASGGTPATIELRSGDGTSGIRLGGNTEIDGNLMVTGTIQSAGIANGAITTTEVDQDFTDRNMTDGVWLEVSSFDFTSVGIGVEIRASGFLRNSGYNGGAGEMRARLKRGVTVLRDIKIGRTYEQNVITTDPFIAEDIYEGSYLLDYNDLPASGTHTYKVEVKIDGSTFDTATDILRCEESYLSGREFKK